MRDWIQRLYLNLNLPHKLVDLLIMDQFRVHTRDSVKNMVDTENKKYFFIPTGCTGLLQPLDVSTNKPVKDYIRKYFHDWFKVYGSTPNNAASTGNLRPPSYDLMIKWILQAWNNLSPEFVKQSFKYCVISIQVKNLNLI